NGQHDAMCAPCLNSIRYKEAKDSDKSSNSTIIKIDQHGTTEDMSIEEYEQYESARKREKKMLLERRLRSIIKITTTVMSLLPREISVRTLYNALTRENHYLHDYVIDVASSLGLQDSELSVLLDFQYIDPKQLN